MTTKIPTDLRAELLSLMSLTRLVKTGLFTKVPPPSEDTRCELRLFRTVLDKALLDQFDKDENYRLQSKIWADPSNESFIETCELALFEPEDVIFLFDQVTQIFRENGEDKYWEQDDCKLKDMTIEDKKFYLFYEEKGD